MTNNSMRMGLQGPPGLEPHPPQQCEPEGDKLVTVVLEIPRFLFKTDELWAEAQAGKHAAIQQAVGPQLALVHVDLEVKLKQDKDGAPRYLQALVQVPMSVELALLRKSGIRTRVFAREFLTKSSKKRFKLLWFNTRDHEEAQRRYAGLPQETVWGLVFAGTWLGVRVSPEAAHSIAYAVTGRCSRWRTTSGYTSQSSSPLIVVADAAGHGSQEDGSDDEQKSQQPPGAVQSSRPAPSEQDMLHLMQCTTSLQQQMRAAQEDVAQMQQQMQEYQQQPRLQQPKCMDDSQTTLAMLIDSNESLALAHEDIKRDLKRVRAVAEQRYGQMKDLMLRLMQQHQQLRVTEMKPGDTPEAVDDMRVVLTDAECEKENKNITKPKVNLFRGGGHTTTAMLQRLNHCSLNLEENAAP